MSEQPSIITRDNSHTVEGELVEVRDIVQHTGKFSTRTFVIENGSEYHDEYYPSWAIFQLVNNRCDLIDFHEKGSRVRVHFCIKGTCKPNVNDNGKMMYFTNNDCFRIEKLQPAV